MKQVKKYWYLPAIGIFYVYMGVFMPDKAALSLSVAFRTIKSVVFIIVAVFILVGLVQVWLKEDVIAARLGEGSGIKAVIISAFFGSLLAGPLFAIFPLLKSLMNRGARVGVIVAMLTTWAVKIPMLPLEVKFLGAEFVALRVILVMVLAIPMSLLMERIIVKREKELVAEPVALNSAIE